MDFPSLLGASYTSWSTKAEIQKTRNLYLETIESGAGRNQYALFRSPGLSSFSSSAASQNKFACRGAIEINGTVYNVFDNTLFGMNSFGAQVALPGNPIATDGLPVSLAAQIPGVANILFAVSNGQLYAISAAGIATVATPFIPSAVATIAGYVVCLVVNSAQIFFSTDGLTWTNLQYFYAQGSPSDLVNIIQDHGELWVFGNRNIQVFDVVSNAFNPFSPNSAAFITQGLAAKFGVAQLDNSLFWLGANKDGQGMVWRAEGYTPVRVSDHGVENAIQSYPRIDDAIMSTFQFNGHTCLRLTFPSANDGAGATWEYDVSTNKWNEPAYWNIQTGKYERHRAAFYVSAFQTLLAFDYKNGYVYEMGPNFYTDAGFPVRWERRAPHVAQDGKRIQYRRFSVFMQVGAGLPSPLWLNGYNLQRPSFVAELAALVAGHAVTAAQSLVLQNIYDLIPYAPLNQYPSADTMNALGFYPWGGKAVLANGAVLGSFPQVGMRYSNDGGLTYNNTTYRDLGSASNFKKRAFWLRCGYSRDRVWEINGMDPIQTAVVQGTFDAVACDS